MYWRAYDTHFRISAEAMETRIDHAWTQTSSPNFTGPATPLVTVNSTVEGESVWLPFGTYLTKVESPQTVAIRRMC